MTSLNIIFFGGQKEKLEELFPEIEETSKGPYGEKQIRFLKKKLPKNIFELYDVYLRAHLYPKLNELNFETLLFDEILENIFKIDQKQFKNNWVIVIFGDEYTDEINTIFNAISQVNRPFLLFVSDNIDKILKYFDSKSPEIRKIGFLKQEQEWKSKYNVW